MVSQAVFFGLLCFEMLSVWGWLYKCVGFDEFAAPLKEIQFPCPPVMHIYIPYKSGCVYFLCSTAVSEIPCIFLTLLEFIPCQCCVYSLSRQLWLNRVDLKWLLKCVTKILPCILTAQWRKLALLHTISFLLRPRSTPTPTGSISANGVPTEALDYDRLKQVLLKIWEELKLV